MSYTTKNPIDAHTSHQEWWDMGVRVSMWRAAMLATNRPGKPVEKKFTDLCRSLKLPKQFVEDLKNKF